MPVARGATVTVPGVAIVTVTLATACAPPKPVQDTEKVLLAVRAPVLWLPLVS